MPRGWSPSEHVRNLPANRTECDGREERYGREENRSHGSARVMTLSTNDLQRECHSAGNRPALADHSQISGRGRDAGPARPALTPCRGVTPVDGYDIGPTPTATNSVLGGTLPRGGDGPPCPGHREHGHLVTIARARLRGELIVHRPVCPPARAASPARDRARGTRAW